MRSISLEIGPLGRAHSPNYTLTKIPFMYSFSGNCAASVRISTFMYLWAIYIFPGSAFVFGCNKIDRPILEHINLSQIYERRIWETEKKTLKFCFGNKEAAQCTVSFLGIHKWEPDIYTGFLPALHLQCTFTMVHGTWTGLMFQIAWALDRPDGSHAMQALVGLIDSSALLMPLCIWIPDRTDVPWRTC